LVEFELPALIGIAQLKLQHGHPPEGRARLDDVWEAAERGPYPLFQAAWCDGPPYAYHWGLQKAKAQLVALGAPEPDMPRFDESRFEPLPEVEVNPKDEFWVDPDKLD
jgi:hypothetical protein